MDMPIRLIPAHSRTSVLKPDVEAMERVFAGPARADLSAAEKRSLATVEADLTRARELRRELKVHGVCIAAGEATSQQFADAAVVQAELTRVEADMTSCLDAEKDRNQQRIKAHQGYGPLTMFRASDGIYVNLKWTDTDLPPTLAEEGVSGIEYTLQRPLGVAFFDLCAKPVGPMDEERLTFLRMDVRNTREEMYLCPADQPARTSEIAPLGAGDGELIQHEVDRPGLEHLTRLQDEFTKHVLKSLGVAWPEIAPCPHCRP